MDYQTLLNKKNAVIPEEIAKNLAKSGHIHLTKFQNKDDILSDEVLRREMGFGRMADGDYLVSMVCPMPNVTKEMIDWWFWWHPQEDIRYQVWYPGEHFKIRYAAKDKEYFNSPKQPPSAPIRNFLPSG